MNDRQDKTSSTDRVKTIVRCIFAFIVLSGLMILVEYTELRDVERREQKLPDSEDIIVDQIHIIKASRREIEAQQREVAQVLQEIT